MKGSVYLIENKINHKVYVGKTYLTIQERWKEHIRESRKGTDRPLYRAIRKYGAESFSIVEIEQTENCEEREKYWINFFNSYGEKGYNATLGGDGRSYLQFTDGEVIQKYLELKSVKDVANYFNCSVDSVRVRLRRLNIEIKADIFSGKRNWKTQKVKQFNLNGDFLREFDSMNKAAEWVRENGYSRGQLKHIVSNISKNIRGIENRKQAYGFIWKNSE